MESSTRFSSKLGRRSIAARIAAVLALAACGFAIYLLVMTFTESGSEDDSKGDKKGRQEQAREEKQAAATASYTVAAGDTLSAIAVQTGVPEPRIERLNPDMDSEALNAGQTLTLR